MLTCTSLQLLNFCKVVWSHTRSFLIVVTMRENYIFYHMCQQYPKDNILPTLWYTFVRLSDCDSAASSFKPLQWPSSWKCSCSDLLMLQSTGTLQPCTCLQRKWWIAAVKIRHISIFVQDGVQCKRLNMESLLSVQGLINMIVWKND